MISEDIQELYKLLRGSRTAAVVLQAGTLFVDNKWMVAKEKLLEARESYAESRSRLLKLSVEKQVNPKSADVDRERRKIERKREKALAVLEAFDELIPEIDRMVKRQQARTSRAQSKADKSGAKAQQEVAVSNAADDVSSTNIIPIRDADIDETFLRSFQAAVGDEKLDVIDDAFGFLAVQSKEQLYADAIYFIRNEEQSSLVLTPSPGSMSDPVRLINLVDRSPLSPMTHDAFLDLGRQRQMVLLTKTVKAEEGVVQAVDSGRAGTKSDPQSPATEATSDGASPDGAPLDIGAFGQLLTSAQRCGIVPGADQIGYIRDREFRKGEYDLAFQAINAMFTQFSTAAGQWSQQLVREEADIKSGRIKISPKELQAKRMRDRVKTQEIERARRRFQIVLEGLRQLL